MVTTLLYGVYCAAISIVLTLISYYTGFWKNDSASWLAWASLPFSIWFIYLAMQERKREDFGGTLTYGQGVGTGALVGLFSGIVVAIFMWLYLTAINPDFQTVMVAKQQAQMHLNPNMTAQQIEVAKTWTDRLFVPIAIGGQLIGGLFFGTVIALIAAIFVRTKEEQTPPAPPPVISM